MSNRINTATLPSLYDHDDEVSGVHAISRDDVVIIFDEQTDEPTPVYAIVTSPKLRRYHVGVRFAEGIIPSADWRAKLEAESVSTHVVEHVERLLGAHAL